MQNKFNVSLFLDRILHTCILLGGLVMVLAIGITHADSVLRTKTNGMIHQVEITVNNCNNHDSLCIYI